MTAELLKEYHAEELADERKYKKLAEELRAEHPKAAGIFCDIAHEEHTHAEMIKHIIDHNF